MGAPKMLTKGIDKQLSELRKMHVLVCKAWDKNFSLVATKFVELTCIVVQDSARAHGELILKYSGTFLRFLECKNHWMLQRDSFYHKSYGSSFGPSRSAYFNYYIWS